MATGIAIETRYLKFLAEEMVKINLKIVALSDWLRNKNPLDKDLTRILQNFPCSAVFVPQLLTDTGIWTADRDPPAATSNRGDNTQEHEADSEAGDINENCDDGDDKASLYEYDQDSGSHSDSEHGGSDSECDSSSSTSDSSEESDMEQRLINLRLTKGPQLARRSIPFPKKPENVQKKNRGSGPNFQLIGPNTDTSPEYKSKSNPDLENCGFAELGHEVEQQKDQRGPSGTDNNGIHVPGRKFTAPSGEQPQEYEAHFDAGNLYEGNDMGSLSSSMSSSSSQYSWSSSSNSDEKKDIKLTVPDMEHNVNVGDSKLVEVKDENSGEYSAKTCTETHVGTGEESEEADPETGTNTSEIQAIHGLETLCNRTAGLEAEMKPCNVKLTRMTQEFINTHNQTGTSGVKRKRRKKILNRKCRYCSKELPHHTGLLQHELIHTGQKPFPCNVCGKFFRQKGNLVSHNRIHTGEKPFACKMCGIYFRYKHVLESHLLVHTGQKPFPCKVCGVSFRQRAHLIKHNRIHTGEKPFACKLCGKCFKYNRTLEAHLTVHTGEKPFVCTVCSRSFTYRSTLKCHQMRYCKKIVS